MNRFLFFYWVSVIGVLVDGYVYYLTSSPMALACTIGFAIYAALNYIADELIQREKEKAGKK